MEKKVSEISPRVDPARILEVVKNIEEFAGSNGLKIHPGRDLQKWAAIVVAQDYHCPCKPKRAGCPCEEALEDIQQQNCCCCRMLVNDAYLDEYRRLVAERDERRKCRRRQKVSSSKS